MIARLFPGRDRRQIKQKWRREELRNPGLLDEAFEKRQFVSAVDYAKEMADRTKVEVDLSGPTPLITPRPPPALDGVGGQRSDGETAKRSKRAAPEAQSGSEWDQSVSHAKGDLIGHSSDTKYRIHHRMLRARTNVDAGAAMPALVMPAVATAVAPWEAPEAAAHARAESGSAEETTRTEQM
jgi:Myb DNA-binding like